MKKRIVSVLCVAMLASVIAIPCIGAETSEDAQAEEGTLNDPVSFDGPFEMSDDEGRQVIGYEVSNASDDTIYAGIVVEFFDESGEDIGVTSAYVPCIAPGEKGFIYVTNYFEEDYAEFSIQTTDGISDYASATDDLADLDILEEADYLTCTAENSSSETIYLPQITVVYTLDSEPAAVFTGMLKEDGETELCLNSGKSGSVDIVCPEEYDDYDYYVTAMFDKIDGSGTETEFAEEESKDKDDSSYDIGETWTVDGQWALTIDSVSVTNDRNTFSDEDPVQVIIIDYHYENLGYEAEFWDGLYLSLDNGIVVDADGNVCSVYPIDVKYPQETPVGAKCTAQSSYGLMSEGNTATLTLTQYDGNDVGQTAVFNLTW